MGRDRTRGLRNAGVLAAIAVGLVSLGGAPARAQTTTPFVLDLSTPPPAGPQVAKRGAVLATLSVRAERAVRLQEDADASATNWMGAKLKRPMQKGDLLLGTTGRPGLYCAPIKEGAWYSVGACLTDADGDGRFEALSTAAFNAGSVDGMAVTDKGAVLGVRFSETAALGNPIAYAPVGYSEGPAAAARLRWRSTYDRKAPDRSVKLQLWLEASDSSSGTGVLSAPVDATLPDGTGLLEVEGVRLRVLGFEPTGAMRYQIEDVRPAQRVTLAFRPAPQTIYIFY